MLKYALALVILLGLGLSVEAQTHHRRVQPQHQHRHVVTVVQHPIHVGFRTVHHNYNFRFVHQPTVVLYGTFAQYQAYNYAVVGYTDLAVVQGLCGQYGFQIVQVNPVQQAVVVRLPATYQWNTIVRFSQLNHVRFIEPGFRRY